MPGVMDIPTLRGVPILLPLVDDEPPERADAARNREALLAAADELIAEYGVASVTMDAVATRAGVGKGTVFRRFDSREGLMAAVLNRSETQFQAAILSGSPPLGPGADPMERLLAFGHARIELNRVHSGLIVAAGRAGARSYAAVSFTAMHTRYLLGELGVRGDIAFLATALLAPLEVPILVQHLEIEEMRPLRFEQAWDDLVRRVVAG